MNDIRNETFGGCQCQTSAVGSIFLNTMEASCMELDGVEFGVDFKQIHQII